MALIFRAFLWGFPSTILLFRAADGFAYHGRGLELMDVLLPPAHHPLRQHAAKYLIFFGISLHSMNGKQRKTLEDIFTDPVSSAIPWRDIENLFIALGALIKEGAGSRVNILLNGRLILLCQIHSNALADRRA
jgi:hypothetical protein